jgi:hypothetical protein
MAEDDAALVIGAVIALAAIYALGAHPSTSATASSSSTHATTTAATSTTHTSTTATQGSLSTFPKCTRVQSLKSVNGTMYTQFPTSSSWSRDCTLGRGDVGPAVTALQRGLSLCMHESVTIDGIYGPDTARAVSHAGQVGGDSQAWYQPSAERRLTWPWYSSTTTAFTGHCS